MGNIFIKKVKTKTLILAILTIMLVLPANAIPQDQGIYLTSQTWGNGTTINQIVDTTFLIYTQYTGGSTTYEVNQSVNFTSGEATTILHNMNVSGQDTYYLGIIYPGETERSPRTNFTRVLGSAATNTTEYWDNLDNPTNITKIGAAGQALNISNITFYDTTGNIGIRETLPTQELHLAGSANFTGTLWLSILNVASTNLTTTQISEGNNLYFTNERAATAVQNTTILRNGTDANFGQINATSWSNVTITESQIIGLSHTTDTDTLWSLNVTEIYNHSGTLSLNRTTYDGLYLDDTDTHENYQWRLAVVTDGGEDIITNNTLLRIIDGTGIQITNDTFGNITFTSTIVGNNQTFNQTLTDGLYASVGDTGNASSAGTENSLAYFTNSTHLVGSIANQSDKTITFNGNLTVTDTLTLEMAPAQCPGNNTWVVRFQGNQSTCVQVANLTLSDFLTTGSATDGYVLTYNSTNNGFYLKEDSNGGGSSSVWSNGSGTIYNSTSGLKVGIGTASPTHSINTIGGGVNFSNSNDVDLYLDDTGHGSTGWSISTNSDENLLDFFSPNSASILQLNRDTGGASIKNVDIDTSFAGGIPLLVTGASSQTANLFVVEESGGTDLLWVNGTGHLSIVMSVNMSNGTYVNATGCDTLDTNSVGLIVCGSDDDSGGNISGSGSVNSLAKFDGASSITESIIVDDGNITIGSDELFVDTTNNRTGIGTTSPNKELDVSGDIELSGYINQSLSDGTIRHFSNGCYEKVNSTGVYTIC